MGAAASDVGVVRGRGDAARRPIRAAAKRAAAPDPGPGRGRGLRELDLCRRHHLCDRGTGRGAAADCRNRAGAAPAVFGRHGGRRRAGGLPRRAVPAQSAHGGCRARRRQSDRRSSFCRARRDVSGGASPCIGLAGLLAGSVADRISGDLCGGRYRAGRDAAKRRAAAGKTRDRSIGLSRRCRTVGVVALGQHGRRQQRSRAARGVAGRFGSDRGSGGGNDAAAAARRDRRHRARRAGSEPAGHRLDDKLQCRRHAGDGRRGFRANAGAVAGGAPLRRADRARRQQSAVPAGFDAVAGQYVVGAVGEPQLLLRRPRIGAGAGAVIERNARNDQCPVHSRVRRRGHAGRRRRHGEKIRLRRRRRRAAGQGLEQRSVRCESRLSLWRKIATADGGFTWPSRSTARYCVSFKFPRTN